MKNLSKFPKYHNIQARKPTNFLRVKIKYSNTSSTRTDTLVYNSKKKKAKNVRTRSLESCEWIVGSNEIPGNFFCLYHYFP